MAAPAPVSPDWWPMMPPITAPGWWLRSLRRAGVLLLVSLLQAERSNAAGRKTMVREG
jgi:hypothetical protein